MFGYKKAAASTGCSGCKVATTANCQGHLNGAIPIIVDAFKRNSVSFCATDPQHLQIVERILAQQITDAQGKPLALAIPTMEPLRSEFLGKIAAQTAAPT